VETDRAKDIICWLVGDDVKHDVVKKMNFRANIETEEYHLKKHTGTNIKDIHKEAVSRGEKYNDIIDSVLHAVNIPDGSVCADLGAGTGTFSALISRQQRVKKVYSVEISERFITHVMPTIFNYFEASKEKIVRVVGDFNSLEFEDNTLDFAVEMGSFHHSEVISKTISECYRVLKPGGFLLAVERARPNTISTSRREWMLNRELPGSLKKKYGIPAGQSYTRRMWGEHEYTYDEWSKLFKAAGFSSKMVLIKPFSLMPPFSYLLKKICSVGPSSFEPFYLWPRKSFLWNPFMYRELISMPIFICSKPRREP
jgi:ubiquinone/menaquinone biosynthesis C-methylase UbiE